jgi:hypothetical protein
VKDVHALRLAVAEIITSQIQQVERVTARLRADGRIGVRSADPAHFAQEFRLAVDIYNEAWTDNWGFLPVTEREAKQLIDQLATVLPPEGVIFGLADGAAVAMLVALPNVNELVADLDGRLLPINWLRLLWRMRFAKPRGARVLLAGVRRRYRGSSLSATLVALMLGNLLEVGRQAGIETVEFSWILEDNTASLEGCYALGARLDKVYRIYGKTL